MSDPQTGNSKPYDPIEPFREMRDAYLDTVAKTMVDVVNTEAYAQATGAMLDMSLTMSAPFREALEKSMLQVLQQLSLPTRQDVIALSERFTNLEMRLDDMDASLDTVRKSLLQSMTPLLQQVVLLTEQVKSLTERLQAAESGTSSRSRAAKTKPAAPARRARSAAAKAPASGSKRAPRKGTR